MSQPTPALKYRVTEAIFDSKSMLDETNFYHQRQGAPSELTRKLTYIMGDYTKNYPISLMTVGGIGYDGDAMKKAAVEIDDVQFTYPVMGRMHKACVVSSNAYSTGDKPGIGNSQFKIRFSDNWIKRFFIIQSARGVQAYVHEDGKLIGSEYEYTVSLNAALPTDYCPLTELDGGNAWVDITTAVAESESDTTESKMVMPGSFKNQMGFLRHGFSWAGNAANKMMKIDVSKPASSGAPAITSSVWMDFAMWQYELEWLSICEHSYWYSRYNRQANGEIALKDMLTGKAIPTGSGLLEQIQNKSTYSTLTYDYLVNQIGDALFGQSDTAGMSITLHGGKGAIREFDRALKRSGAHVDIVGHGGGNVADKFISGTAHNLALGGFYDTMYHIDGYTIKIKHNPIFDSGKIAIAQQAAGYTHPETGWPLESYRMVFIDDNDYDGQPNIQHVAQKGRSFQHGVVAGLTNMPKSLNIMSGQFNLDNESKATLLSSTVDKSAYTRFKSAGIQILRANRCFDFQCVAGQ
jgi:hypothetical protein